MPCHSAPVKPTLSLPDHDEELAVAAIHYGRGPGPDAPARARCLKVELDAVEACGSGEEAPLSR